MIKKELKLFIGLVIFLVMGINSVSAQSEVFLEGNVENSVLTVNVKANEQFIGVAGIQFELMVEGDVSVEFIDAVLGAGLVRGDVFTIMPNANNQLFGAALLNPAADNLLDGPMDLLTNRYSLGDGVSSVRVTAKNILFLDENQLPLDYSVGELNINFAVDGDNDGFTNDVDCNDGNAEINPGAEEIADGVDNNCNGEIDEGFECLPGAEQSCGGTDVGVCQVGTQICIDGIWGVCEGIIGPSAEVCDDALDNNCDGQTDEGCGVQITEDVIFLESNIDGNMLMVTVKAGEGFRDVSGIQFELIVGTDQATLVDVILGSGLDDPSIFTVMPDDNNGLFGAVVLDSSSINGPLDMLTYKYNMIGNANFQVSTDRALFLDLDQQIIPYEIAPIDINFVGDFSCVGGDTQQCGATDVGICEFGLQTCVGGVWGSCEGEVKAKNDNSCNGLDDDCDGIVDNPARCHESDGDNDGIDDSKDKCLGTPENAEVKGNGCPKHTRNLNNIDIEPDPNDESLDLGNIPPGFKVKEKNGLYEIEFAVVVSLLSPTFDVIDFDDIFEFGSNLVKVDDVLAPQFTSTAAIVRIVLSGEDYPDLVFGDIEDLIITRNGVECTGCEIISTRRYTVEGDDGSSVEFLEIEFSVPGFSEYSVAKKAQSNSAPSSSGGGGGGGGGGSHRRARFDESNLEEEEDVKEQILEKLRNAREKQLIGEKVGNTNLDGENPAILGGSAIAGSAVNVDQKKSIKKESMNIIAVFSILFVLAAIMLVIKPLKNKSGKFNVGKRQVYINMLKYNVSKLRKDGHHDKVIKKVLVKKGWPKSVIKEGMDYK